MLLKICSSWMNKSPAHCLRSHLFNEHAIINSAATTARFPRRCHLSICRRPLSDYASQAKKVHRITVLNCEEKFASTGSLSLQVPFHIQIRPLNIEDHPDMSKIIVKLVASVEKDENENVDASKESSRFRDMFTWQMNNSVDALSLTSTLTDQGLEFCGADIPFTCTVEVPVYSSMEVITKELGSISVSDMESNSVYLSTEKGGIHCNKLKCGDIKFESTDGDVLCTGVTQGNISIKTAGVGSVTGMRFQGNKVNVATEKGSVDISAVYADQSQFSTISGNLNLENYHGSGVIDVKEGNVAVTGLDGNLKIDMDKGDVGVQVSRFHSLHILNKSGNIEIKVPENLQASLELEANDIKLEKRLRVQGRVERKSDRKHLSGALGAGKGPLMMVFARKGNICLSIQDWLSSLQLGGVIPEFSHKGDDHEPLPLGR